MTEDRKARIAELRKEQQEAEAEAAAQAERRESLTQQLLADEKAAEEASEEASELMAAGKDGDKAVAKATALRERVKAGHAALDLVTKRHDQARLRGSLARLTISDIVQSELQSRVPAIHHEIAGNLRGILAAFGKLEELKRESATDWARRQAAAGEANSVRNIRRGDGMPDTGPRWDESDQGRDYTPRYMAHLEKLAGDVLESLETALATRASLETEALVERVLELEGAA